MSLSPGYLVGISLLIISAEEIAGLSLKDIEIGDLRLPEGKQFARLINNIHRAFADTDIDLVLNSFTRLE